mgnify:CR=1 FL=1
MNVAVVVVDTHFARNVALVASLANVRGHIRLAQLLLKMANKIVDHARLDVRINANAAVAGRIQSTYGDELGGHVAERAARGFVGSPVIKKNTLENEIINIETNRRVAPA